MSRRPKTYTTKQLIKAITGSYGIIDNIRQRLGCSWHTADEQIKKDPEALQAWRDERNKLLDFAELKGIQALNNGSETMIRYYLSTLGKDRGFTQEQSDDKEETDNELTLTITDEAAE